MRTLPLLAFLLPIAPAATAQFGTERLVDHTTTKQAHDVELSDLDGDGDLDLVVSTAGPDATLVWFSNRGDGTFFPRRVIGFESGFDVIRLVDMDGDADPDLVGTGEFPGEVYWYRNLGGGSFSAHTIISTLAPEGKEVDVADLNGDGQLDVLSASLGNNRIAWYAGNGNGAFGAQQTIATIDGAYTVHAADLDGDGDADVVAGGQTADGIHGYSNAGNGTFTPLPVLDPGLQSCDRVRTADINGDGTPDIVALSTQSNTVKWYANNGSGTFAAGVTMMTGNVPVCAHTADLDADGDIDLIVGDLSIQSGRMRYWTNNGSGSFSGPVMLVNGFDAWAATTGDITGDGVVDVVGAYFDESTVFANDGTGTGTFGAPRGVGSAADAIRSVAAADLDGDGLVDVVEAVENEHKVAWFRNQGDGTFSIERVVSTEALNVNMVHAADMDGDGDIDLVSGGGQNGFGSRTAWYANDGSGNFAPGILLGQCAGVRAALCADVEGDGDVDILAAIPGPPCGTGWSINDGTGTFSTPWPAITNPGYLLAAADLDGDGDQDLLSAVNNVRLLENAGGGVFTESFSTIVWSAEVRCVKALDMDEDGDLDVSFTLGNTVMWHANNSGSIAPAFSNVLLGNDIDTYTQADVDGDGLLDIVGANGDLGTLRWARHLGGGSYAPDAVLSTAIGDIAVMELADMDADGGLDLLTGSVLLGKLAYWPALSIPTSAAGVVREAAPLTAYPNPFTQGLTVECPAAVMPGTAVELRDPQGRLLRTWRWIGGPRQWLPCGTLPAGPYVLRVLRPGMPALVLRVLAV